VKGWREKREEGDDDDDDDDDVDVVDDDDEEEDGRLYLVDRKSSTYKLGCESCALHAA
jgi:hypothetical protein